MDKNTILEELKSLLKDRRLNNKSKAAIREALKKYKVALTKEEIIEVIFLLSQLLEVYKNLHHP